MPFDPSSNRIQGNLGDNQDIQQNHGHKTGPNWVDPYTSKEWEELTQIMFLLLQGFQVA
jgi:phage terminase small subunit